MGLTEPEPGNSLVPQGRRVINHGEHQAGATALSSPLTAAPVQGGRGNNNNSQALRSFSSFSQLPASDISYWPGRGEIQG